jgi:hypothetical protein
LATQVFISHTKLDKSLCDRFDITIARVGLKAFRSELENIRPPAWSTIIDEINRSCALFLLVGEELVKAQAASDVAQRQEWKFTQNWISYEVGVASQRRIDVWVVCDTDVRINFPVPYLNNYQVWGVTPNVPVGLNWWKLILDRYKQGLTCGVDVDVFSDRTFKCVSCGAVFNFHSIVEPGYKMICPTCLQITTFPSGWLLDSEQRSFRE